MNLHGFNVKRSHDHCWCCLQNWVKRFRGISSTIRINKRSWITGLWTRDSKQIGMKNRTKLIVGAPETGLTVVVNVNKTGLTVVANVNKTGLTVVANVNNTGLTVVANINNTGLTVVACVNKTGLTVVVNINKNSRSKCQQNRPVVVNVNKTSLTVVANVNNTNYYDNYTQVCSSQGPDYT